MRSALLFGGVRFKQDALNDAILTVEGQAPFCARRAETFERLGLGKAADKLEATAALTGISSERIERDGFITQEELTLLSGASSVPKLARALLERPLPTPVKLTPAERQVTTQVRAHYNPDCVKVEELGAGYRAIADLVLATLDTQEMKSRGYDRGGYSAEGIITSRYLESYLALPPEALCPSTSPTSLPLPVLLRQAKALLRHITEATFSSEARNDAPAVTPFPVAQATIELVTLTREETAGLGLGGYHFPNRRLEVKVPEGHTVVINAQAATEGTVALAELVLGHRNTTQPYQLPYLPGLADGEPAELWITVLKGKQVVDNQVFAVPANPITERSRQLRIPS